jgi:hypothetical protein
MGSPNSVRSKKGRQVKSNVKSMLIIVADINGIVHKEFVLAGQEVNSAFYYDIPWRRVKMCEDLAMNFGNIRTRCCIITHQPESPFSPGFFTKGNMAVTLLF